jgi:endothelin-converting enzyme/putative endopeptidase
LGSFDELRQKTDADALAILKEAATNPKYKSDTDQGKAINLYKTILDTIGRNKLGITPLKPYLKKIDAVKTKRLTSLINRNGTLRDWFL